MSLQSDLEQAVARSGNEPWCSVCEALPLMEKGDREWLLKALASKLGAKPLSVILRKNGIAVGVPSIHSHRSEGHS